jgi:hypothetical protein
MLFASPRVMILGLFFKFLLEFLAEFHPGILFIFVFSIFSTILITYCPYLILIFLFIIPIIYYLMQPHKPILISFLASKQAGKDTCGDYLVNKYGFKKDAFAKSLKDICKIACCLSDQQLYGSDEEKNIIDPRWNKSSRQIMQHIGTELFRNGFRDDIWIYSFKLRYNKNINTAICDVRFQNEVDCIKDLGGYVIKLVRSNKQSNDMHISEQEINTIENFDYEIINDGTLEELYKKLEIIYADIISKKN